MKKKYTNTSGQTLLTVKDTQYVSFSLMPSDTEDELRPPSPVRNDDGSLDDKENVPPNITYSPVREYYSVYNTQQNEQSLLSLMYYPSSPSRNITNYSLEPVSSIHYIPSLPPNHPVSYDVVRTEEDSSQPGLFF